MPTIPPNLRIVTPSPGAARLFVLESGDTLASLAAALKVSARQIVALNVRSVAPTGGSFSCAEGRAISAWVLAISPSGVAGRRLPVVARTPNTCEPGLGFAAFAAGQAIALPDNSIRRPFQPGAVGAAAAGGFPVGLVAALAVGFAVRGVVGAAVVGAGYALARKVM